MVGITSAVFSSFFIGLSQFSLKKSFKELPSSIAFFLDMMFGLCIWIPLSLYFGVSLENLPQVFIYAVISAILSEALYFYILTKGQLSVTSFILGSYSIYTVIFSRIINHEMLNLTQLLFILITICGTIISIFPDKIDKKIIKEFPSLFLPIIGAICVGFSDTISKSIINVTNDYTFLFALAIVQIPVAIIFCKMENQRIINFLLDIKQNVNAYKFSIIGSIFNVVGTGLLWVSFSLTLASIASPIISTSSSFTFILAIVFLKEKMTFIKLIGLLLGFIGIIGLSFVI